MSSSYDDEIKVALTANAAQLEEGVAEATASIKGMQSTVAQEAAAFNAAVNAKVDAMVRLNTAFNGNIATAAGMAEAELAIDQAMATGALTASEYAGYIARLDAAEAGLATTAEAATAAIAEQNAALAINGGVAREIGVLFGELARGNYTRLEGSTITLANRTGFLSTALRALTSPLGLAAGAAAAFGYEIYQGEQQSEEFNKTLISTGGYLGVTEGRFNEMARAIVNSETTIGSARDALTEFGKSGKVGGEELQAAAKAAVDFADLTGQSMDKAVAAILKLEDSPTKAIMALNEHYHFLTEAEFEHIQHLEEEGQKTEAAAEAVKLFQQTNTERLKIADQDVGLLTALWRGLKQSISDAGDELKSIGRKSTIGDQINEAKRQIAILKSNREVGQDPTGHTDKDIAAWQHVVDTLKNVQETEQKTAEVIRSRQKVQDDGAAAAAEQENFLKGMKGADAYAAALNRELEILKQIHAANANSDDLKGITFDSEGNANGGEGLAKIEAYLHKKYDVKAAAHQNEHKLDEQQLAIQEADEGISYDKRLAFELNFWQEKMAASHRGTLEYAQAYRQVQTLQRELDQQAAREADREAKEELRTKLSAIDQLKAAYDGEAEVEKQRYQNMFDAGEINAEKLAQLEKDLVARKLAADIAYLTAKRDLDRAAGESGAAAAEREEQAIVSAKEKASLEIKRIEDKETKDSKKIWDQYGQQVQGAFKTAINGMLFQGETLKQGIGSVALTMGEDFIAKAIDKPLQEWIAADAAKLAHALATILGISTANETQQAADQAEEATKSAASITRASAVAGANGVASFAAAPWPIDLGAPAFGASMAATAAGFSVTAAAGGWERVPADDAPALLHRNEMVLPAYLADRVRDMTGGDQGGGQVVHQHNYHFQTPDARSFEQWLRRGGGAALGKYVSGASKNSPLTRT